LTSQHKTYNAVSEDRSPKQNVFGDV